MEKQEIFFTTKARTDIDLVNMQIDTKLNQQKPKHKVTIITKNVEVSIDDEVLLVDTSESDVILNLPNDSTKLYDGKFFYVKDISNQAQTNFVTINPNGLSVDNKSSLEIILNGGSKKIIFSKVKNAWYCISN